MKSPTLFTNFVGFDCNGAPPLPGEGLVRDERSTAVAPAPAALPRDGVTVVDGKGAVLMPGMVEAHAHLSWPCAFDRIILDKSIPPEEHLLITARNARITLDHGFTSAY